MTSAEVDLLTTAAFIAALSINRQAFIPISALLLTYCVKPWLFSDPIILLISYSVIYASLSTSYIKIKSEIRYAMIAHAALYWLLAVDYYLFDYATLYYNSFKPMVRLLDLYIFYHLMPTGGLSIVASRLAHLVNSFNMRLLRL